MKILIPDHLYPDCKIEYENVEDGDKIIAYSSKCDFEEISNEVLNTADAILAWDKYIYNKEILDQLKNCKIIVRIGAGVDNFDLEYAKHLNIKICNTPSYGIDEVTEHAMAMAFALSRRLMYFHKTVSEGNWLRTALNINRIRGKTFGVVGCGKIGSAFAIRMRSIGCKVIFYDPYVDSRASKITSCEQVNSLIDLINISDVISIHTPLSSTTKNLINKDHLSEFKKGSIIINTARGGIVNEQMLAIGLKQNIFSGVGLDVLSTEPLSRENPLIEILHSEDIEVNSKLLITPHVAYYSKQSVEELRTTSTKTASLFIHQGVLLNCVN